MSPHRPGRISDRFESVVIAGLMVLTFLMVAVPAIHAAAVPPLWTYNLSVTRVVSDVSLPGGASSYVAVGSTLYSIWSESIGGHVGGTLRWSSSVGGTINDFPSPVQLRTGTQAIFLSAGDGFLYRINPADGTKAWSYDTRRPGHLTDQVIAAPSVQLYNQSNPPFRTRWGDDIVYVITRTVDDPIANSVHAVFASTGAPAWKFNSPPTVPLEYGSELPAIDYDNNRIYFGVNQEAGGSASLWAINTVAPVPGPVWSMSTGPIRSRPLYQTGKLYIVATPANVQSRNPATGALIWSYPTGAAGIVRNPWPEFRSPAPNRIYIVDTDGRLHALEDSGFAPIQIFPPTDPSVTKYTTMPVVLPSPSPGKIYVGRCDGTVQQIDATSGVVEASVPDAASASGGMLYDPSLDSSVFGGPTDRLMVTVGSRGPEICSPWGQYWAGGAMPIPDVDPSPVVDPGRVGPQIVRLPIPWAPDATSIPTVGTGDAKTQLAQNAPNPFAARTRIEFTLRERSRIELAIFDVAGRLVRTLAHGEEDAGAHALDWDGRDEAGEPASSGVYFYRLRTQEPGGAWREESRRIVRVK